MDDKDLQELIKSSLLGKESLRQSSIRLLAETNEKMLAEGVPAEIVAIMSARIMGRLMEPSMSEIARGLFPIQPLPPGAMAYCDSEPNDSKDEK